MEDRGTQKKVNYTDFEKNLLVELVNAHKNVIESKVSNASMIFKKENAWKKLAAQFNSTIGVENKRIWGQLRKKWGLMKSISHKEIANERRSRRKTGGGHEEPGASNLSCRISNFLPSQATPLQNVNDSDASYFDTSALSDGDCSIDKEDLNTFSEQEVLSVTVDENNNAQSRANVNEADNGSSGDNNLIPNNETQKPSQKKKSLTLQQRAVEFAKEEHELKMKILNSKLERENDKRQEHILTMELLDAQIKYWDKKSQLLIPLQPLNDSPLP